MSRSPVVDVHMHIYETKRSGDWQKAAYEIWEYGPPPPSVEFSRASGDLEDAERAMAAAGYDYAVSVNLFGVELARGEALAALPQGLSHAERQRALAEIDASMPERLRAFNRWACDVVGRSGRILPFVALDPSAQGPEENAAHLRDLAERHGARGVKLHPVVQGFVPNDPRLAPSYRTCVEMGLAVLAHSGTAKGPAQYAEPRAFADLARAWPDLTLILAHLGGGSWRQTLELARAFPNLHFDCCEIIEWTGAANAPTAAELARLILDVGAHRVMLGTDFPWYDLDRTLERVMALPLLAREEKEAILGANAARLLGLETPPAPRPAR
jgi:predicted TIM-barrel fold metal-dependent hydrolase